MNFRFFAASIPVLRATCLAFTFASLGSLFAADEPLTVEDPAARQGFPKYQYILAATPEELTPAQPVDAAAMTTWWRSQGDAGSRRYSALKQITKDNVSQLEVAWTYHSEDGADNIQATPIIVGRTLFAPTPGRALVAIDAVGGIERWRFQLEPVAQVALEDAAARRGLIYWPGDATHGPRLLFGGGNWIYALDPETGKPVAGFGQNGRTAIPTGATPTGAIYQHVYVTSGFSGDAYGYDLRTGEMLWRFHSIPKEGEFGAETWVGPTRAGANGWGGLSMDDGRGIAYVSFGAARPDMVGVARLGDNLYSNCVVAIDALTGKRRWHFQDVRHDIWDLDVCAPPNLVTITRDGKQVDAVTGMSKGGHLLLLDRLTGKPIFPFRLRLAPASKLPGERTALYQPDPELPEPISDPEFKLSDITNRTKEAHDFVQKIVERSTYGFFEPFTEGKPNLFIGSRGGAEWSGAAVDVPTGRLYLTSNRWVSKVTVFKNDEWPRDPKYSPSAGELHYQQHCAACHGPNREGQGMVPPLYAMKSRLKEEDVLALLKTGRGAMPPNLLLDDAQKTELLDYLYRRNQPPSRRSGGGGQGGERPVSTFDGYNFLVDHEGYPGINPPWGLLNCYDLNTGKILWRVPLGEHEELTKQGVPLTGSQSLGGATVTAGGLVFVAGTIDQRLRAFDADTGKELWSAKLPFAGTSAPAIYEVDGRQYVVITATGGGKVGGPKGDAYVSFALKQ